MLVAGSFLVVTGLLVWLRHRGVDTDAARTTTSFAFYFVLLPSCVLFFLTVLALGFSSRRNATFRMISHPVGRCDGDVHGAVPAVAVRDLRHTCSGWPSSAWSSGRTSN